MDIILRNLLTGVGAGAAYTIVNALFYAAGLLPSTLTHYSALLIMPPGTPISPLALTMGVIADLAASFFGSIVIDLILLWTGRDHAWLKGLSAGGVLWIVHAAGIPALVPRVLAALPPSMVTASFIFSVLWGLLVGQSLRYLSQPRHLR